ncbi:hypothetical protein GCM10010492_72890 [Saccharothrix mutabilis subsp. mutabilis]|uniref:Uncharacterized protein n=2 Tax=Saccharothrix mutabilis TaxID=33921 RepID=A0ABN0UTR7_9PSEU
MGGGARGTGPAAQTALVAAGNLITPPFRPGNMRTLLLGALLLTAACGDVGAGRQCTAIGALVGLDVDVELTTVETGRIEVCWDDRCVTPELHLSPSSKTVGETCTGDAPDSVCGASAVPTGGKNAYVPVPDLPAKPVTVALKLVDEAGATVVDERLTVTPKMVEPNGPGCGTGGPQAGVVVAPDGSVRER